MVKKDIQSDWRTGKEEGGRQRESHGKMKANER